LFFSTNGILKRLVSEYVRYYHEDRTHLALAKGTPGRRQANKNPVWVAKVASMPKARRSSSSLRIWQPELIL